MKKSFILLTAIITILLILTYSFQAIAAPNYASWNKYYQEHNSNSSSVIIGQDGVAYNLESSKKVVINQYVDVGHSDGSMFISILNQPNVWCAEHGTNIGMKKEYNVASWTAVSDSVLAYILASRDCDTDDDGKMDLQKQETDASQVALWYYLNDSKHADRNKIVEGGIATNKPETTDDGYVKTVWDNGLKIYNAAKNYNSTPSITISNSKLEGEYIKFNLSGNYDSFKIYLNDSEVTYTKESTGKISVKIDPNTISEANIKAVGYKKAYTAGYYLLKRENCQRLMVVTTGTTNKSATSTTRINISTDISLQKYIVGVSSTAGNAGADTIGTARRNKYAVSADSTLYQDTNSYNHKDHNISNFSGENTVSTTNISGYDTSIKRDAPVKIEAGDKVTYRITVYNNSNVDASEVKVYDDGYPSQGTITEIKAKRGGGSYSSASSLSDAGITESDTTSGKKVFTFALAKNTKMDIYITIRYDFYSDDLVRNRAYIQSTNPSNKKDNRTIDGDYIEMEKYQVSLEKYVTQVTDKDGNNVTNITGREGKRYNSNASTDENKNTYKPDRKVEVEAGDLVTFTIKLTNTGTNPVKITKIYDSFKFSESGTSNGLKLIYDDTYGIQGNGGGSIDNYHYSEENNEDKTLDRYLITFNNAPLLNGGASEYVTIRFKVEVPTNLSNTQQSFWNVAAIVTSGLQNKNGVTVSDSDGTDNNRDQDYLKTKVYSVSLEKFVSAINGNNLSYNENYDINNDGIVDAMDSRTILKYSAGNIELDANQIKKADINGDGKVNAQDARKLLQSLEREEHPTYVDTDKENAPVSLEVGDEVTYTIKLENTGNTTIKVTEIEDTFDDNNNANIIYVDGSISGYGNSFNVVKEDGKLKITLQNPEEIPAGEFRYLTLKFTVDVPVENTDVEQLLKNTAEVKTIINRNDVIVKDGDGETNNIDSDWVKTKVYSVSLEKYVSKVENTDGSIEDYSNRANLEEHSDDATNTSNLDNVTATVTKDTKYNTPVIVSNGDKVTYTIKVTNDGNTNVKITNVADYLPNGVEGLTGNVYCTEFKDENGQTGNVNNYSNIIELSPKETKSFEITVTVTEPNISMKILKNVAEITSMKNRNDKDVLDTTGKNNKDADYIQLDYIPSVETTSYTVQKDWGEGSTPENVTVRLYKVKADGVEEYITGKEVVLSRANNWTHTWQDLDKDLTYIARELSKDGKIVKDATKYSDNITTEYTEIDSGIIITNYPTSSTGISYTVVKVWDDNNNPNRPTSITVRLFKNSEKVEDIELNNSNWSYTWKDLEEYDGEGNLIRYTAKELKNGSWGSKVVVEEGEKYNHDYTAHYLEEQNKTTITNKMENSPEDDDNLAIGGIVWNDLALDKTQNKYDGLKEEQEEVLAGVKVMLHRVYVNKSGNEQYIGEVASTYTNENGEYSFTNESLSTSKVPLKDHEKFIKGPRVEGEDTKRWDGTYYYYYVVFEYDGVTYTSTTITDNNATHVLGIKNGVYNDSNAREKLDNESYEGIVAKSRTEFNKGFSIIDNSKDIDYTTINESGYIPQSIHKYNSSMKMQSSTKIIRLTSSEELEKQLKHVNLGLRGRDTFDLELTSDVYSTKVTVNGVGGNYTYNSNKVTVRRTDANNYNYSEDTANPHLNGSKYDGQNYNQSIRQTDVNVNTTKTEGYKTAYGDTGLGIEVTYKITVTNASNTAGAATKITNYYDDKYVRNNDKGKVAYYLEGSNKKWIEANKIEDGNSRAGYKSLVITTPGTRLNKTGDKMEIYVVYTYDLTNEEAKNALFDLNIGDKLATYNMAEITAYKTFATGNNEATRGLIDKDSAPGSANSEKVRLHPDQIGSESTVKYYFGGNDLSILKYEDDTYATPTLIIAKVDNPRVLTGTVFEDKTKINSDRVKSGNGIKDNDEKGVYGATVQLIELKEESKDPTKIADGKQVEVDGKYYPVRYTRTADANGEYTFTGYLPGKYIIKYHYGDTSKTVLLNQKTTGINAKSYNGEDFQATNNSVSPIDGLETNKLDTSSANFWYAVNEEKGVSTATDNGERRKIVSQTVSAFTTDQMKVLNDMRDGLSVDSTKVNDIISKTKMDASTPRMLLTVEEATEEVVGDTNSYEYNITNMNFGIAEVPVTTIDMQKSVSGFTIVDSTGQNEIARLEKDSTTGEWKIKGDVIPNLNDKIDVSIEDEKLQGARLQITYDVSVDMRTEKNFDNTVMGTPTITCLVDFVNNNLSYNENLGNNAALWEVATYDGADPINKGAIDPTGTLYTTVLKAKPENPLLQVTATSGKKTAQITLEKVLSSTESTIDEIITSTVDTSEYFNIVEILGLNYDNTKIDTDGDGTVDTEMKDRIRTPDRYIIIPGVHSDSATSEIMVIHAPTGDSSISMVYYLIAIIGLTVLAVGVFGIKKFVVKK